jgi:MYXO-CTERM domain-containing protein
MFHDERCPFALPAVLREARRSGIEPKEIVMRRAFPFRGGSWLTCLLLLASPGARADGMQIFVRTPAGELLVLDVDPSDTIESVVAKLVDRTGSDPACIELRFEDRPLEEGRTLADYRVQKEATLEWIDLCPPDAGGPGDPGDGAEEVGSSDAGDEDGSGDAGNEPDGAGEPDAGGPFTDAGAPPEDPDEQATGCNGCTAGPGGWLALLAMGLPLRRRWR